MLLQAVRESMQQQAQFPTLIRSRLEVEGEQGRLHAVRGQHRPLRDPKNRLLSDNQQVERFEQQQRKPPLVWR